MRKHQTIVPDYAIFFRPVDDDVETSCFLINQYCDGFNVKWLLVAKCWQATKRVTHSADPQSHSRRSPDDNNKLAHSIAFLLKSPCALHSFASCCCLWYANTHTRTHIKTLKLKHQAIEGDSAKYRWKSASM